jgi:hypothetical protein
MRTLVGTCQRRRACATGPGGPKPAGDEPVAPHAQGPASGTQLGALYVALMAALVAPTHQPAHQRSSVTTSRRHRPSPARSRPCPSASSPRRRTTRAASTQTPNLFHLVLRSTLLKHPCSLAAAAQPATCSPPKWDRPPSTRPSCNDRGREGGRAHFGHKLPMFIGLGGSGPVRPSNGVSNAVCMD